MASGYAGVRFKKMALIFENSVCPFCELLLNDGSETGALPALFNTEHSMGFVPIRDIISSALKTGNIVKQLT